MSSTLHKIKEKLSGDSSTTGTTSTTSTSGDTSGSSGYNTRSSGRNDAYEEAPVVKEREHDLYEHHDNTQREEIHDQTRVNTTIQPIKDQQERDLEHTRVDHGTEVHEHGRAGLDENAEAELRRRRDEVARQGGKEHDESYREVNERPDVHERTEQHTVEQVQPVIEKDVYQPHRVDHHKKEVDIHHEPTQVGSTQVAPTVTVDEYNRRN
jgi:hypothetical protein